MLQLEGNNLGERHKCLNSKINSSVEQWSVISRQESLSDIEVLLNIGIATKNCDINFILDILKSGNDLYISKALKSVFIFNAVHADIMNPEYLTAHIFPYVSLKMKRKILIAISAHLQGERAEQFFDYCMKNMLLNNATKFFIYTSDAFKLKFINSEVQYSNKTEFWATLFPVKCCSRRDILKFVCNNSFELAEACLINNDKHCGDQMLHDFRYLYFVSNDKYLDLLEKYAQMDNSLKIGLRISKDITIKHKDRILKQPLLYALKLRSEMLVKHSSHEEVKIYATAILPNSSEEYWHGKYSLHIFYNIFPVEKRFEVIKEIFAKTYPGQEFEDSSKFLETESFNIMAPEEKQQWALNKIYNEKDIPEAEKNFYYYKLLNIDTALQMVKEELPKLQSCFKRTEILLNIVESCATPQDIEKLLQFYLINNKDAFVTDKENFLNKVLTYHSKIFQYGDIVWTLLLKLLLDKDLLSLETSPASNFETVINLYHMLQNKPLPLSSDRIYTCWRTWEIYLDKLNKEQKNKVFQVLLEIHINKLLELETKTYDQHVQSEANHYVKFVLTLFRYYKKSKTDIPEIVHKFAKLDRFNFSDDKIFLCHEVDFNKGLKNNVNLVKPSEELKETVMSRFQKPRFNLTKFLKKLKIYFANDNITTEYIKTFQEWLDVDPNFGSDLVHLHVHFAVLGIFALGTPLEINNFLLTHVPTEPSDRKVGLLSVIRKAITRLAYRAPFESHTLKTLMKYVCGGYLHYYLQTLPSHVARLPLPLCLQFLEALLEHLKLYSVRTVEKVIRPLCNNLNEADLQLIITKLWDNNSCLKYRRGLYTALLHYLRRKVAKKQIRLYNLLLKQITINLCVSESVLKDNLIEDTLYTTDRDDREVLVPEGLQKLHIETVWEAVKCSEEGLKYIVMRKMADCIHIVGKSVVEEIVEGIVQDFVEYDANKYGTIVKWELLSSYLIYHSVTVEDNKEMIDLASNIINIFLESRRNDAQSAMFPFVAALTHASVCIVRQDNSLANKLLEHIADLLKPIENLHGCYTIKLAIVANTIIDSYVAKLPRNQECDVEGVCRELQKELAAEVSSIIDALVSMLGYDRYKLECNITILEVVELIHLQISDTCYARGIKDFRWYDLALFFCKFLVSYEKRVTHMLALRILPSYSIEKRKDEYEDLLDEIDSFDDAEVRAYLKKNFSGSKRRRLETAAAV